MRLARATALRSDSAAVSVSLPALASTAPDAPVELTDRGRPAPRTVRWRRSPRRLRRLALGLAYLALASAAGLLLLDTAPRFLQTDAHLLVSAAPLAAVAAGYLAAHAVLRPTPGELIRGVLLSAAFLLWAANALLAREVWAAALNDAAIALFVLDLVLTMRVRLRRLAAAGVAPAVSGEGVG